MKIFIVKCCAIPEYGKTQVEWTRYFSAPDIEVVREHVYDIYGKPHYYKIDRIEIVYEILENEVEELNRGKSDDFSII